MIYFDNAATTGKKPDNVIKAVEKSLKEFSVNPGRGGYELSNKCAETIYNCRAKVAEMFNADSADRVVFTQNCTESLNFVIKGVLKPYSHFIISSLEHNAVARPAFKVADETIEIDVAEVVFDDDDATVRSFERLIKENTKLIVCTHASNVTGHIMPIEKIGELCKKHSILFCVDAAQTAGIVPIDMQSMNIDFLCIAPHKGLYAPMGTGILIANKNIPDTIIEGGTGTESIRINQPMDLPERFESGTVNVPGIFGISAGVDFVNSKTIEKIHDYEVKLATYFYEKMYSLGNVIVYSPNPKLNKSVPTIAFNVNGYSSNETASILSKNGIAVRAGLHCAPLAHKRIGTLDYGVVRVCFSVFNNVKEINQMIDVIKNMKK